MSVAGDRNLHSKNIFLGHYDGLPGLESLEIIDIKDTKENQKRLMGEIKFERGLKNKLDMREKRWVMQ